MVDFLNIMNEINTISSVQELEKLSVELLGKNGALTIALKDLSKLSLEEKKKQGGELNLIRIIGNKWKIKNR